jgi:hypothetical protein
MPISVLLRHVIQAFAKQCSNQSPTFLVAGTSEPTFVVDFAGSVADRYWKMLSRIDETKRAPSSGQPAVTFESKSATAQYSGLIGCHYSSLIERVKSASTLRPVAGRRAAHPFCPHRFLVFFAGTAACPLCDKTALTDVQKVRISRSRSLSYSSVRRRETV